MAFYLLIKKYYLILMTFSLASSDLNFFFFWVTKLKIKKFFGTFNIN